MNLRDKSSHMKYLPTLEKNYIYQVINDKSIDNCVLQKVDIPKDYSVEVLNSKN